MSNVTYSTAAGGAAQPGGYPWLGIVPQSTTGRMFLAWGLLNVVLALLPVFDILGNGAEQGPLAMPLTIFYCYAVFSLNCLLGAVYYLVRGRAWVALEQSQNAGPRT
ncbi:hypothetical protein [Phaeobacter sp. J2-8]|uniref:hypothetical protein n=1 Tax=Phaeobacter sp. J2-8 TaxID=2931394 RepID=UPI001FD308A8|nr:hypothetical protein [Phaeobacter sp. J2-8]MCJ7874012.1 hypothetical protein [Phaeobacter sp. J2-8]